MTLFLVLIAAFSAGYAMCLWQENQVLKAKNSELTKRLDAITRAPIRPPFTY